MPNAHATTTLSVLPSHQTNQRAKAILGLAFVAPMAVMAVPPGVGGPILAAVVLLPIVLGYGVLGAILSNC